jgi:hypothetical protein
VLHAAKRAEMQRLARAEQSQRRRQALLSKKMLKTTLEKPAMIAVNEKV